MRERRYGGVVDRAVVRWHHGVMKTKLWIGKWQLWTTLGVLVTAGWLYAQNQPSTLSSESSYEVIPGRPQPGVGRMLDQVDAKLNRIIQQQGGRYIFLVSSDGDLWRLDTYTGKVAILNLVSGAQWDTLDVPERTLKPGNGFYEQFVQKLDKINFNTN